METLTEPEQKITKVEELPLLKVEHERVLVLVLSGENPTSAYRQVYDCADNTAKVSSSRLMKSDNFASHLRLRREQIAQSLNLSHDWVLGRLKGIANDCLMKGKGYNPSCATRALELLGKHLGTFEPKASEQDKRPAFVGISINMGDKPSVKVIRVGDQGATLGATKDAKDR